MSVRAGWALALPLLFARGALADGSTGQCHVVAVDFVPSDQLQIVAWVEQTDGTFVDTIYVTNKIGMYGLGNRPGRFDFNSGPPSHDLWPYGRRITTFPVWSHRHGLKWPEVDFQDGDDDDLSHPFDQSSAEGTPPYCRPMDQTTDSGSGWDTGTCASPGSVYTDKGTFSATAISLYPPRSDLTPHTGIDSPSVAMYKTLNPFDAVTQATPAAGAQTEIAWPIPQGLAPGNYVLFVEVAKEYDFNSTYNSTVYPSPTDIPYNDYGVPYRGQPSVVYSAPFTIGATEMMSTAQSYIGYGDPTGATGTLNPPDSTITSDTPASGASRLEVLPGSSNVLLVDARPVQDSIPPGAITQLQANAITGSGANVQFIAPGNDGDVGKVTGYEVRIRANDPITADNFEASMAVAATITPATAGALQSVALDGLLPETTYYVGIRAYDACHNESELAVVSLTTTTPLNGEVDACFVATAAYGSLMANDVELLRHFRDSALRTTVFGELFVETYYTFGPPVAGMVGSSELLRATARDVLAPLVRTVRHMAF